MEHKEIKLKEMSVEQLKILGFDVSRMINDQSISLQQNQNAYNAICAELASRENESQQTGNKEEKEDQAKAV